MSETSAKILERLEAAGDRAREAHFFLHSMEDSYHFADQFRWHLNAFLRPLDEIPLLVTMAVQLDPNVVSWHRERSQGLRSDPLIEILAKERDFVVHRGMLLPTSSATIGITEGRGMKLGIGHPVDPRADSDSAMAHFAEAALTTEDFLGILTIDDEDSLPAIERSWVLKQFPDVEVVDLCAEAWLKLASYLMDVEQELGEALTQPDLSCRHGAGSFRIRVYDRIQLRKGIIRPVAFPGWAWCARQQAVEVGGWTHILPRP